MKKYIYYFLLYLVLLFLHHQSFIYIYDDAYIHFRIAENLIDFGVPYYNINEAYMSSSSTLWTMILAFLYYSLDVNYINVFQFLSPLLLLLNSILYLSIIEGFLQKKVNYLHNILFFIFFISISLMSSMGLMETQLTLFLVGLALYLFQKNNLFGFIYLSIAIFLRLEITIFFILFFIYFSYKNYKDIPKIIVISILSSIPFLIYDFYYFGTLIPLPAHAKSLVYDLSTFSVAIGIVPTVYGLYGKVIETIAILFLIIYIIKSKKNTITQAPIYVFSLGGLVLLFAYILKKTLIFGWYQPLYLIPIMVFFFILYLKNNNKLILVPLIFIMLPFIKTTTQVLYSAITYQPQYLPEFSSRARVQQYLSVSKRLYEKYPDYKIMTSEIGGLGYGFKGSIIDGMGLIQPDCLKYYPMSIPNERSSGGIGAIPPGCVVEKLPELIVSYDIFIESLSRNEILNKYNHYKIPALQEYDLKIARDKTVFGSTTLNVYIRKNIDKGF